jgi:hypothetical protein
MRRIAALVMPLLALAAQPLAAQEVAYEAVAQEDQSVSYVVYEMVDAPEAAPETETDAGGARLLQVSRLAAPQGMAAYGPFRVLDERHAALVGVTDGGSPEAFAAMLRDHPGIATLEMIACPGTEDDRANLRLGRMIRGHGLATHVPDGGFVGSGAVELFLAGLRRYAEPSAAFAVHSWEDESGRQPQDYAANAPENRAYLDYYRAVGMSASEARAFYAMTNSVPFESAKWLTSAEMAQWVKLDPAPLAVAPQLDSVMAL